MQKRIHKTRRSWNNICRVVVNMSVHFNPRGQMMYKSRLLPSGYSWQKQALNRSTLTPSLNSLELFRYENLFYFFIFHQSLLLLLRTLIWKFKQSTKSRSKVITELSLFLVLNRIKHWPTTPKRVDESSKRSKNPNNNCKHDSPLKPRK